MGVAGVTAVFPLVAVALGLMGLVGCRDPTAPRTDGQPSAARVTYAKDVAPILFEYCAGCHHPKGSAPFSVLDYEAVRTRGQVIVAATETRTMPPWLPEPGYGEFAGDRRLTPPQIETIHDWVEQGMPEGSRADLPPAPEFADGWLLGDPDLVVTMPRALYAAGGRHGHLPEFRDPGSSLRDTFREDDRAAAGQRPVRPPRADGDRRDAVVATAGRSGPRAGVRGDGHGRCPHAGWEPARLDAGDAPVRGHCGDGLALTTPFRPGVAAAPVALRHARRSFNRPSAFTSPRRQRWGLRHTF